MPKVAPQADLWYNSVLKMLTSAMLQTSARTRQPLIGGSSVDTLYPHAQDSKTYVYTLAYPDGKVFYVGKGIGNRINAHEKEALRHPTRSTYKLNTIRKIWANGGQIVKTKLAAFATHEEAIQYEIALIFFMDGLTNRTNGGDGAPGFVQSEEQRRKTSLAHKTSLRAIQARERLFESLKGRTLTEETIGKMRVAGKCRTDLHKMHEASRGRVQSEEERAMRSARLKGKPKKPFTQEHLDNMSAARKGKPGHPVSDEAKRKISEAHKGRVFTEEHKQKLSEAHKGKRQPLSEETKRKISEKHKGRLMHPVTDEMRRKISDAGKGRVLSEDNKRKMQEGRRRQLEQLREDKLKERYEGYDQ